MEKVLVTGATGTVGSAVVEHLRAHGQSVVAAVRGEVPPGTLAPGVETRAFDFGAAPAELEGVLDDVDRVFLMRPPAIADVATYLFPFVDAALRRRVRRIAFLSLQGVQFNRSTPHHAVEAYLREQDAPATMLRPNFFMQNLATTYAGPIRERDEIFVPAGRSHTAFIDARDVGRVAAAVLSEEGHVGRAYTLSGEQSLSYRRVARTMTEVLGRPIAYRRPSEDAYLAELAAAGAPEDYIAVQRMIHRVVRLNVSALPNRSVRRLTGRPATTLEQFVREHREVWAPAPTG